LNHICLIFSAFSLSVSALTTDEISTIRTKLEREVIRGSMVPTALRLSFHDCVGGCNGCLNVDNPSNGGLSDLVEQLETLYQDEGYSSLISRADFWALAGIAAVDKGIENANEDCDSDDCAVPDSGLVFQWGRQDCSTSPYTTDDVGLPGSTLDHDGVMDFFATEFGFDENQTVALMGAHTLGQMNAENSGHSGVWTVGEANDFNNQYFKDLVDPSITWKHRAISTKIQWNAPGIAFMLNIDVALYIDIQTDADGESSCDFTTCEAAPTATAVEAFAESNEVWIPAFTEVFTKMLAHGSTELYDPEDA